MAAPGPLPHELPAWVNAYVNPAVPYVEHGREMGGADCWGLVYLVFRDQLGIALPTFDASYVDYAELDALNKIKRDELPEVAVEVKREEIEPFDVLLFRGNSETTGASLHVGVAATPLLFLHTFKGSEAHIARLKNDRWRNSFISAYRSRELIRRQVKHVTSTYSR